MVWLSIGFSDCCQQDLDKQTTLINRLIEMADRKGKRRKCLIDPSDSKLTLSTREKEQFLLALKQHGFNVIYDLNRLRQYLPNKSDVELNYIVETYIRKGKDCNAKQNYMESYPGIKTVSEWSGIVSSCVPFPAKKDDLADCLKDIFKELGEKLDTSQDSQEDPDVVDYKAIHAYFNDILNNRFPAQLPDREAAVALSLVQNLLEMMDNSENDGEKAYLKTGNWWKTENLNRNSESIVSDSRTIPVGTSSSDGNEQTNEENNNGVPSTSNSSEASQSLPEVAPRSGSPDDPNRPEIYQDVPRIRKIRECLNPLKIPIDLLIEKHKIISTYFL